MKKAARTSRLVRFLNSKFEIRTSKFILLLLIAWPAFANELAVDRRTVTLNDSLTITLTLTDNFASLDSVRPAM